MDKMGEVSVIFSYLVFFNVVLSYGMETAFFRFYNTEEKKENVVTTSMISLLVSTLVFFGIALFFKEDIAVLSNKNVDYIFYTILILTLDTLVIIPFSKLRAEGRPIKYAVIKIGNVAINLSLNIFFLLLMLTFDCNCILLIPNVKSIKYKAYASKNPLGRR